MDLNDIKPGDRIIVRPRNWSRYGMQVESVEPQENGVEVTGRRFALSGVKRYHLRDSIIRFIAYADAHLVKKL